MNTNLKAGDKVICTQSGNAYDNGNRVFKGEFYIVLAVIDNKKEKINGESCDLGVTISNAKDETPRGNYPYVWSIERFEKVED